MGKHMPPFNTTLIAKGVRRNKAYYLEATRCPDSRIDVTSIGRVSIHLDLYNGKKILRLTSYDWIGSERVNWIDSERTMLHSV